MAFKTGVVITGDSKGGVKAIELTSKELRELNKTQRRGARDTKSYAKEASRSVQSLKSLASGFARATKMAAGFGAALAGAATFALTRLVKDGLKAADALGKTSDKLGVTTEALAGLRVAAERSGVAANSFDTALQRLTRRTAEAAQGTGAAKDAFKALGLSASELAMLSPDEVLKRVADGMQGVTNQSERVSLAFKLFDTEGVALVNTMGLISGGMDEIQRKSEIAGVAMDRGAVASIERANDAMADLQLLQQGFSQQLAIKFAPMLENIANRLFNVAEEAGGMGKVAEQVFNFLIDGAGKVATAFDTIAIILNTIRAAILSTAAAFAALIEGVIKADIVFSRITFQSERVKNLQMFLEALQKRNAGLAKEATEAWEAAGRSIADFGKTGEQVKLVLEDISRSSTNLKEIQVVGFERVEGSINGVRSAAEEAADANVRAAQTTASSWERAGSRISGSLENAFAGLLQRGIPIGGGGFGAAIGGALSSAVAGSVFSGGSASGGGGGVLGGLGGALAGIGGNINQLALHGRSSILGGLNGLGLDGAANFFGKGTANLAGLPGGLAGGLAITGLSGFAGGKLGGVLGESLFGKEANSNIGQAAGGIGGAALGAQFGTPLGGPIGAAVGALVGALADVAFGGDGKKRFNAGIVQGRGVGTLGSEGGAVRTGASGLEFQTFNRRAGSEGSQAANAFLETVLGLDQALTALTESTGANVDFSRTTLGGINADAGKNREGPFFGLKGFNGTEGSLEDAADEFVSAWLDEVNSSLPKRVRQILNGVDGTAQEIVGAFEQAISIDRLLDLDVVKRTEEALKEFGKASGQSLLTVYDDLTEAVLEAASGVDGSATSLANLNSVLGQQKSIAAELAAAYKVVGIEVDAALGNTIQNIRESLLNEEQLYSLRRDQIADITAQIAQTTDPGALRDLSMRANQLIGSTFGNLEESQQQALAPEFIATLERIQARVDSKISQGESEIGSRESGVRQSVDMELGNLSVTTQTVNEDLATFGVNLRQLNAQMAEMREGGNFRFSSQINSPTAGYRL